MSEQICHDSIVDLFIVTAVAYEGLGSVQGNPWQLDVRDSWLQLPFCTPIL